MDIKYEEVKIDFLKVGMLLDRPLFVYLPSNDRYIQLVKPLSPLEEKDLEKIHKIGKIYSNQRGIDEYFPELNSSAKFLRELCNTEDEVFSPFEKDLRIRESLEWLRPILFTKFYKRRESSAELLAPLYLINRTIQAPGRNLMNLVAERSVVSFERGLRLIGYVGCTALLLGYSDVIFLQQLLTTAFLKCFAEETKTSATEFEDYRRLDSFFKDLITEEIPTWQCEIAEILVLAQISASASVDDSKRQELEKLRIWAKLRNLFQVQLDVKEVA